MFGSRLFTSAINSSGEIMGFDMAVVSRMFARNPSMSAVISPCGTYRYLLTRAAESLSPMKSTALFVMLNPSTADATLDDPALPGVREALGLRRPRRGEPVCTARNRSGGALVASRSGRP
ncbi:DUF1643 domain-containing protein [Paraburkholderia azotifigens]